MDDFALRRDRLWHAARAEGLDALVITNPVNVTYLTGFTGEATYLILTATHALAVSDGRFTQQLGDECPSLALHIRPPTEQLPDATAAQLQQLHATAIGFESTHLTVAEFEQLRAKLAADWKPGSQRVELLRRVKDANEVGQIRQAIAFAEAGFTRFRADLRPEASEKEMADDLEHCLRQEGASGPAFATIAAVGERAALPHAPPTGKRLDESAFVLVDWGASGRLYKSDLTRVLWTRNNAANSGLLEKLREVFAVVAEAHERAREALRPGVAAKVVDAAARQTITDRGYGPYFNHSIGHGFGLQIHEAPVMRANTETPLEAGMVVTIEPGIYLPGWGGVRLEDDYLIVEDGAEKLTHAPRDWDASELDFSPRRRRG